MGQTPGRVRFDRARLLRWVVSARDLSRGGLHRSCRPRPLRGMSPFLAQSLRLHNRQMLPQPLNRDGQLIKFVKWCGGTDQPGKGRFEGAIRRCQQARSRFGQLKHVRSTIAGVGFPTAVPGIFDPVHHLARPTDSDRQRRSDVSNAAPLGSSDDLHHLQPGQRHTMNPLDCRVHLVPQLRLQANQTAEEADQVGCHERHATKQDSEESNCGGSRITPTGVRRHPSPRIGAFVAMTTSPAASWGAGDVVMSVRSVAVRPSFSAGRASDGRGVRLEAAPEDAPRLALGLAL